MASAVVRTGAYWKKAQARFPRPRANYNCKFFAAVTRCGVSSLRRKFPLRDSVVAFVACLRWLAGTVPSPPQFRVKSFSIIREAMGTLSSR